MANAGDRSSAKRPIALVSDPILRFAQLESAGAILLLVMTIVALAWANSPWSESYFHLWETRVSVGLAGSPVSGSLHHWINDGLMAGFPMDQMPEVMKNSYLAKMSQGVAEARETFEVEEPVRIELVDQATGTVMATVDPADRP